MNLTIGQYNILSSIITARHRDKLPIGINTRYVEVVKAVRGCDVVGMQEVDNTSLAYLLNCPDKDVYSVQNNELTLLNAESSIDGYTVALLISKHIDVLESGFFTINRSRNRHCIWVRTKYGYFLTAHLSFSEGGKQRLHEINEIRNFTENKQFFLMMDSNLLPGSSYSKRIRTTMANYGWFGCEETYNTFYGYPYDSFSGEQKSNLDIIASVFKEESATIDRNFIPEYNLPASDHFLLIKKYYIPMLKVVAENQFGNKVYEQDSNGDHNYYDLPHDQFWSVLDPSQEMLNRFEYRQYGDTKVILSRKAAENIATYGNGGGSICVLWFKHNDTRYSIIVGDNKKYLMNPGGGKNDGECFERCAVREVKEELNIDISEADLVPLAEWTFSFKNDMIGSCSWIMKTTCFSIEVGAQQVSHLFNVDELSPVNVFDDLKKHNLSETEMILVISDEGINVVEEFVNGKRFSGHHKKLICDLFGIENSIDISYLKTFKYLKNLA